MIHPEIKVYAETTIVRHPIWMKQFLDYRNNLSEEDLKVFDKIMQSEPFSLNQKEIRSKFENPDFDKVAKFCYAYHKATYDVGKVLAKYIFGEGAEEFLSKFNTDPD